MKAGGSRIVMLGRRGKGDDGFDLNQGTQCHLMCVCIWMDLRA